MERLNFKVEWPEGLPAEAEILDLGDGEILFSGRGCSIRLHLEPKYARRLASFLNEFADRLAEPSSRGGP